MADQFDIWRTPEGELVLILQHDLLADMATRAVCLVLPASSPAPTIAALGPIVTVGDLRLRIVPSVLATMTIAELGQRITNVAHDRDRIIRAFDVMLSGT
jgi:toxin CcdB